MNTNRNIAAERLASLNRRHFLRGLGATVALPLLDAMLPFRASATAALDKPRREQRDGKEVWIINPYDNARALLETVLPESFPKNAAPKR